jgi:hypothetical protein
MWRGREILFHFISIFNIFQVGEICDKLVSLVVDGQDSLRDIYGIGLRTLVQDIPEELGKYL